eukprot:TRINITY_DN32229_c0_g1_i1.p1 TRINITY_DN32229_c0_g1~~TRINITY_DN32229_c0_g1_i1.p1  ORF type:complete len:598 (+),score=160.59 TRINITY_DN32229_c0_g1_i1:41-1795(+)
MAVLGEQAEEEWDWFSRSGSEPQFRDPDECSSSDAFDVVSDAEPMPPEPRRGWGLVFARSDAPTDVLLVRPPITEDSLAFALGQKRKAAGRVEMDSYVRCPYYAPPPPHSDCSSSPESDGSESEAWTPAGPGRGIDPRDDPSCIPSAAVAPERTASMLMLHLPRCTRLRLEFHPHGGRHTLGSSPVPGATDPTEYVSAGAALAQVSVVNTLNTAVAQCSGAVLATLASVCASERPVNVKLRLRLGVLTWEGEVVRGLSGGDFGAERFIDVVERHRSRSRKGTTFDPCIGEGPWRRIVAGLSDVAIPDTAETWHVYVRLAGQSYRASCAHVRVDGVDRLKIVKAKRYFRNRLVVDLLRPDAFDCRIDCRPADDLSPECGETWSKLAEVVAGLQCGGDGRWTAPGRVDAVRHKQKSKYCFAELGQKVKVTAAKVRQFKLDGSDPTWSYEINAEAWDLSSLLKSWKNTPPGCASAREAVSSFGWLPLCSLTALRQTMDVRSSLGNGGPVVRPPRARGFSAEGAADAREEAAQQCRAVKRRRVTRKVIRKRPRAGAADEPQQRSAEVTVEAGEEEEEDDRWLLECDTD